MLDAKEWFLSEEEITDSRGGIPRDDMAVYTTGNKVASYTVADEFFNAVYDDLSATNEGDRVMLATWMAALVPLKPDEDPTGKKTGFKEVFSGIVERGGYEELDAMTFIEAADKLPYAVNDESWFMDNLEIESHVYFFAITDAIRKVSDPQDTCTYSGNRSTKETE
ncbi:hypothetical protein JG687_00009972 [Phytophthora cactorum]|nr:hypothetical protein JG687_00009972 [Phytophthora cactorum]